MFDSRAKAFKVLADRTIKKIKVGNKEFGISRFADDIYVFEVACPHAAYDLTAGKTSPFGTIVCSWHNYQFSLINGQEIENRCNKLKVVKAYSNALENICFQIW